MTNQLPGGGTTVRRLEMRGIGKSFGGVPVLRDVALDLDAGEVLALLGSNGAGKSTLVKILCGAYGRDAGEVRLDGRAVAFAAPDEAVRQGVRLLPQEISVFPDLTVAENIVLGDLASIGGALSTVDRRAMRRRAGDLLRQLGLDVPPDLPVRRLGASEQRVVEIARALAGNARILVMDEPTAALTDQEANRLFAIIDRLRAQQVGIIYISHYLDEVFRVADRIAVLRDGRNAGLFTPETSSHEAVLEAMLGTGSADLYPSAGAAPTAAPMLEVEGLSVPGLLDDVSLSVGRGEIVGVFGLIGSGIEGIGRAVYGALGVRPRGRMRLAGRDYAPKNARAAKVAGVGFVAAERKREGIIGELTVRENMTLPFLDRFGPAANVSVPAETAHVRGWIERLGIRTRGPEQRMRTLSGGNQQKICIARWLVDGMRLLVLEEPTRGVDVGARREIYAQLRGLADQGLAILVVSTDVEEVAGLSDRSIVLDRGQVAGRFGRGTAPAALMARASGTDAAAASGAASGIAAGAVA